MEIIEKQVEKTKEVPYGYWENCGYGYAAPTVFQAQEKSCEDTLALQKGLYDWALTQQSQRFADRQTLNAELFSVWKREI